MIYLRVTYTTAINPPYEYISDHFYPIHNIYQSTYTKSHIHFPTQKHTKQKKFSEKNYQKRKIYRRVYKQHNTT